MAGREKTWEEPKPPTHRLKGMTRGGEQRGDLGVGWESARQPGRVSVKLNVGVSISWRDDLVLTLFPIDRAAAPVAAPPAQEEPDDDIPF